MKIKVGHLIYDLLPLPPLMQDTESAVGMHSPDDTNIYITTEVGAAEQVRILFHELAHAFFHVFNIPKKPDRDEEGICLVMESPLAILFRDNPKLLAAICEAFTNDKPLVSGSEKVVRNRRR